MTVVNVQAPLVAANGGKADLNKWTSLLREIKTISLTDEANDVKKWLTSFNRGENPDPLKLDLPNEEFKKKTDPTTAVAKLDIQQNKSGLIQLNSEVRESVERLERGNSELDKLSKMFDYDINSKAEADSKAKDLSSALNALKQITKAHNALMHVPLITHKALSKAAAAIKARKKDE